MLSESASIEYGGWQVEVGDEFDQEVADPTSV